VRPKQHSPAAYSELYEQLLTEVLRLDGWRCQARGAMSNVEVHHKVLRSHPGDRCEQNLMTLCRPRHAGVHHR
jgi:5-methylcytosine-specific restriction endonuclease McrA